LAFFISKLQKQNYHFQLTFVVWNWEGLPINVRAAGNGDAPQLAVFWFTINTSARLSQKYCTFMSRSNRLFIDTKESLALVKQYFKNIDHGKQ
jgi:hypothetical protein